MSARNLLPRDRDEFRSKAYWDNFFRKRKTAFEWYGNYRELRTTLCRAVASKEVEVLVVGCGNSDFSSDMYDDGMRCVTNIDFSERVIREMRKKNRRRASMQWEVMDMTKMTYSDESFDLIVDKGSLDALAADESEATMKEVAEFFVEIQRVLRIGGKYVCITLGQEYILRSLLSAFPASGGWRTEVSTFESSSGGASQHFPLVLVISKLANGSAAQLFYNVRMNFDASGRMLESSVKPKSIVGRQMDPVVDYVDESRNCKLIRNSLAEIKPGRRHDFDLSSTFRSSQAHMRYAVTVFDHSLTAKLVCGVFLVPQGREQEWLFRADEGLHQLAESAGASRLIVIKMVPGRTYNDLESVKEEIGPTVRDFAPLGAPERIPIMSVDNSIGSRREMKRGNLSSGDGEFVVEEVERDSRTFRRMVFLNNPSLVQSEIRLQEDGSADPAYLCFEYHAAMLAGIASLCPPPKSILLIGLGGGSLANALRHYFPAAHLTVCELDPEVLSMAVQYFDLRHPEEGLTMEVDDGIAYMSKLDAGSTPFDVGIIDVDNKDLAVGMSCPPPAFFAADFLRDVYDHMNPEASLLLVNIAARSRHAFNDAVKALQQRFDRDHVYSLKPTDDDVNLVLLAERLSSNKDSCLRGNVQAFLGKREDELDLVQLSRGIKRVSIADDHR